MDADPKELLLDIQRRVKAGIDVSEEEYRILILGLREGRRSAAEGQKKARKAPTAAISLTTLFQRAAKAEGIETP